jgi:hypothetical protein
MVFYGTVQYLPQLCLVLQQIDILINLFVVYSSLVATTQPHHTLSYATNTNTTHSMLCYATIMPYFRNPI